MRVITKIAQMGAEGWTTSFEIVQDKEALSFLQSLAKKGSFALSFYVERPEDMPSGWQVATEEHVDRKGGVHKVQAKTSAGLYRVYQPTSKAPASVSSLRERYGAQ